MTTQRRNFWGYQRVHNDNDFQKAIIDTIRAARMKNVPYQLHYGSERVCHRHTPYASSTNERSRHMIFDENDEVDEVTSRDIYFFFRGELKEYMRNHPDLNGSER